MLEIINKIAAELLNQTALRPKIGIVLGSGLGGLTTEINIEREIKYADIEGFPVSTVSGHGGSLIFGTLNNVEVVAMNGRFHYYEGYDMKQVTLPIRVMKQMGVQHLILSNAAGGMNPDYNVGDLVLITDHLNMFMTNPLIGKNDDRLGPRFPDMGEVYSKALINLAAKTAEGLGISYKKGVYVGVSGPCYETPAEYKMYRILGGDCVGMSTVPEAIVARHSNMNVLAFSIITDLGIEGKTTYITHEDVIAAAKKGEDKMTQLVKQILPQIAEVLSTAEKTKTNR